MPMSWSWAFSSSSWLYEINSSTLPFQISKIKLMFSTLLPLPQSIISTTCLVTLALCLSPFSSGGRRNVLPIRSLGSKLGIGLDPDGFSSPLDLMKTVGAFCFGYKPSGDPSGDPEEVISSEGSEDVETSTPCGASLWLGVEDFLGLTALL